jgi:hypothetical protein
MANNSKGEVGGLNQINMLAGQAVGNMSKFLTAHNKIAHHIKQTREG